MPAPSTKGLVKVKVTNAVAADYVVIQNETQGWITRIQCNADGEVIYSPLNDDNTLSDGDKVYGYVNGRIRGNGSGVVSGSSVEIKFTATADTTSQAVSL